VARPREGIEPVLADTYIENVKKIAAKIEEYYVGNLAHIGKTWCDQISSELHAAHGIATNSLYCVNP